MQDPSIDGLFLRCILCTADIFGKYTVSALLKVLLACLLSYQVHQQQKQQQQQQTKILNLWPEGDLPYCPQHRLSLSLFFLLIHNPHFLSLKVTVRKEQLSLFGGDGSTS